MSRQRATIIQVAARAQVSKSTASMALRGEPVARETLARVRQAAAELGYVYDRAAAAMRGARSGAIGLVIVELANPYYAELAAGVSERFEQDGVLALLANTSEDIERQRRVLAHMREHRLDGLIFCPAIGSWGSEIATQIPFGLPVVALRKIDGLNADYSGAENEAGMYAASRHLLDLGHRHFAYAGDTDQTSIQRERFAGVLRAMVEAGLPPPITIPSPPSLAGGVEAVNFLAARDLRATALICFNDIIAIGACSALSQRGWTPGRELSITGFDDIAEAELRSPGLTTVAIQPRCIGRAAAELILDRKSEMTSSPRNLLQPARLVIRSTTGAPQMRGRLQC